MLAARLGLQFRRRLWWLLVPLTLLPQYFNRESFGADTPTGALPEPAIIGLYAVFFVFGVFFYRRGLVPRRWWMAGIPLALFIFPVGVAFSHPDGAQTTAAEGIMVAGRRRPAESRLRLVDGLRNDGPVPVGNGAGTVPGAVYVGCVLLDVHCPLAAGNRRAALGDQLVGQPAPGFRPDSGRSYCHPAAGLPGGSALYPDWNDAQRQTRPAGPPPAAQPTRG